MSAPLAQPAEVAGQDPFMNIAAKLSSMSKQINMAGSGPLGERSVNIPSAGVVSDEKPKAGGKKRKSDESVGDLNAPPKKAKKPSTTKGSTKTKKELRQEAEARNDVSAVQLPGEDRDRVPVYDTCDDVRTKIKKYLRDEPSATNAGFVREVNRALGPESSLSPVSAVMLRTFMNGHGPAKGAESPLFYGAYVLFEKLRVKHDKPKSKKRLEMEEEWGRGGMHLSDPDRGIWVSAGDHPWVDKYGKLRGVGGR